MAPSSRVPLFALSVASSLVLPVTSLHPLGILSKHVVMQAAEPLKVNVDFDGAWPAALTHSPASTPAVLFECWHMGHWAPPLMHKVDLAASCEHFVYLCICSSDEPEELREESLVEYDVAARCGA